MEAYNERTNHYEAVWRVHLRNILRNVGAECHRIVAPVSRARSNTSGEGLPDLEYRLVEAESSHFDVCDPA